MSDVKVTIPRDDFNPNQRTDIDVEVVNPDGTVSTKTVKGAVQATTQEDGSVSFGILASAHVPFATGGDYATEVLADSPIAYYRLGEASGTTMVDSSGNAHHGVHTGQPPALGVTGLIAGDADTCADYQSSADFSRVDDAVWMDFSGDFSVEAWVNLDARLSRDIAARWSSTESKRQWILGFDTVNDLRFIVQIGGTIYEANTGDSGATVGTGSTYHIVGTYDSTTGDILLYANGSELASASTGGGSVSASDERITVGCRWGGSYTNGADGRIDEVAIYDSVLSPARISAHYAAGT